MRLSSASCGFATGVAVKAKYIVRGRHQSKAGRAALRSGDVVSTARELSGARRPVISPVE